MSATLVLSPAACAGSAEWATSFVDARAEADAGEKDMLLLFTGSDWCPPCMALEREVLDKPGFSEPVSMAFVPVLLDYPSNKPQPDATRRQNSMLQSAYHIQGYPTLLLTDAQGQVYAKVGYDAEMAARGPAVYAAHLMQLRNIRRTRDAAFADAEAATGLDRARALDRGLDAVGPEVATAFYATTMNDVVVLDPHDEAGLKSKYQQLLNVQRMEQAFGAALTRLQSGDLRGGLDDVETMIATYEPSGEVLQTLELIRGQALTQLKEPAEAKAAFERSIAAAPTSPAVRDIRLMMEQAAAVGQ